MLLGHRAPLPPSCHEPERIGATLGASGTSVGSPAPRVLRVFTLAGDCVLEKTYQEMRPSSQIAEVIHMLCQKMDLKPCRLQLLDGRRRLQPHHALKSIWTSGSDLELQVVVVPGPSLDLERDLTLSNPEVLEVRHWQRTVAVRIRPARLLESLAEEVKLHHRVTLSSPRIFGKVHSSSADMEEMVLNTAPVDDSGPGCDLVLELDEGFYGGLDTGFRSLKMYYGDLGRFGVGVLRRRRPNDPTDVGDG
ncbi:unnamed protein product [Durusdinium trenchii]|uniref:Ubiquitin-like domain-containing protein n=1 Tax=Durusdinium trenchii TaxID=1381693 RepID=A0ABP0KI81_9DINO